MYKMTGKSVIQTKIKALHEFAWIPADSFEITECFAVFSYPVSDPDLERSVREHGIINPVTAAETEKGFQLICGNRRLASAKKIGIGLVPAMVIRKNRISTNQLFDLAYSENVSSRKFNLVEAGGIISMLVKKFGMKPGEILSRYHSVIDFRSGRDGLERLMSIYMLEDKIKTFVVKWNLTVSTFSRMLDFDESDRESVFENVDRLQLHGGKLKQFLELIFEVHRRDGISAANILTESGFLEILENDKITTSQKQAKLIKYLSGRRYPELSERARTFLKIASEMEGLKNASFSPPLNFEGSRLFAKISFRSVEDLDEFCKNVNMESNRDRIRSLLELL